MLQCNRCRMQLPDGTQTCSRCGGTVLTPIQVQPQQSSQGQGQMNNGGQQRARPQGRRPQGQAVNNRRPVGNNQQAGQRPQRPQRPMFNGQDQPVTTNQQFNQNQPVNDDFFGEGFEDFNNDFDQQLNQQANQQNQQVGQQNNQMSQQNKNNTNKKFKIQQPSKDGSSIVDWLIMMVFLLIPILNIWCIFKTLSKNSTAPDYKKNYIKAFLIYFIVMSVLSFIITSVFSDSIAYWIASTFLATK